MDSRIIGIIQVSLGVGFWVVAILVELAWLALCFGSVVVGLVLLIFAPWLLIAPLAFITVPGNGLIFLGIANLLGDQQSFGNTAERASRVYEGIARSPSFIEQDSKTEKFLTESQPAIEATRQEVIKAITDVDIRSLAKTAKRGYPNYQYELGRRYAKGEGVKKDPASALVWFKRAAEKGHAGAQFEVGVMFVKGYGVVKKPRVAINWFLKAAEQGHGLAMFNLGYIYANGDGVPQDGVEAIKWYKRAANNGNAKAIYNLGSLYYYGQGVSVNKSEALKWYRQAGDSGDANAQYKVGEIYENGDGVSQDLNQAEAWYQLAAEQGHEKAKESLDDLRILQGELGFLDEPDAQENDGFDGQDLLDSPGEEDPIASDITAREGGNCSSSKEGFSVVDSETHHAMVVSYDGNVYQGFVILPELNMTAALNPWQKGENPFEDDNCYWATQWDDDIDDLIQVIIRPDKPFSCLLSEVESLNQDSPKIVKFNKKKSQSSGNGLESIVLKKHDTGYVFVDIMNDLAVSADDIMSYDSRIKMSYGYARRCAAAALYLQGLIDEDDFEHASVMFKGLQAMTGHTVEFQEEAAADAITFMQTYNPQITKLLARQLVVTAMQCDPPEEQLSDADLVGSLINRSYQEQWLKLP